MYMANMSCHLQARSWIQHVWIWENFQTLPGAFRAGLKDSQIVYFSHIILVIPIKLGSRSGTLTLRHAMNPNWYEVGESRPRRIEGDSPCPTKRPGNRIRALPHTRDIPATLGSQRRPRRADLMLKRPHRFYPTRRPRRALVLI